MAKSTFHLLFFMLFFSIPNHCFASDSPEPAQNGKNQTIPFKKELLKNVKPKSKPEALPEKLTPATLTAYLHEMPVQQKSIEAPQFEAGKTTAKTRSPFLAAFFSAILPGAGEFYAENYWRSALFVTVEIVGWQQYYQKLDNGHKAEHEFVKYANAKKSASFDNFEGGSAWDARRYAQNLSTIYENDPNIGTLAKELGTISSLDEIGSGDYSRLNAFERQATFANGSYFSHTLPGYGEQQYYELIGKYATYTIGWYDFPSAELSNSFSYRNAAFRQYATMRGNANSLLKEASTILSLIVLNHALSIADAIWATALYNEQVETHLEIKRDPVLGRLYPKAAVSVKF